MVGHHAIVVKDLVPMNTKQPATLISYLCSRQSPPAYIKQWQQMLEGMGPLDENLALLPVEECDLLVSPTLIGPGDPLFNTLPSCLVRVSQLRKSNLGTVEVCQVAKVDPDNGSIRFVHPPHNLVVKAFEFDQASSVRENPMHEITIHQRLTKTNSPNIVPLLGCLASPNKMFAVYPYFDEGDLFHNLSRGETMLSEQDIRIYMRQMLTALQVCHESLICHRDVSLENFLVCLRGSNLVLIDFGLSVEMDSDFSIHNDGPVGKTKYMAPELVLGKPSIVDGRKVDVWSLGIVLFMLLTKSEPFHVALNVDARYRAMISKRGMRNIFEAWGFHVSPALMNLLEKMLSANPDERPTIQEILAHPGMSEA